MRIRFIKQINSYMSEYEALETGVIITSAGDHPGPEDTALYVEAGETFQLYDRYIKKNEFTIEKQIKRTP